ncbi:MAG: Dyp-type peroxidase family [Hyphomicrobiales bacterium]|nr:Dyp-type peroxidase family [Hyphomicrobiales bacterium]
MQLDLSDIQGNVLRGYRLPFARYIFLRFREAKGARDFLALMAPLVTNAEIWDEGRPASTLNVAISATGLEALELPVETLTSFPPEFIEGMARRSEILGDRGASAPDQWEPLWSERIDAWMSINAASPEAREARYALVTAAIEKTSGAEVAGYQDAGVLFVNGKPAPVEHFGFADGFAQPDFVGGQAVDTPGDGKMGRRGAWDEIQTGEFLLGHRNEADELPVAPKPWILSKNGSFLVYRKLQQNVTEFRSYVAEQGARYQGGPEKLMAKMVGRWRDGTPLALSPDKMDKSIVADPQRVNNFVYGDDPEGLKCPVGAHVRRANPRDSLGFDGRLATRRRIVRRGLPYGSYVPEGQPVDDEERGIIFMALNASISRQFEFVQQQWINYGNDLAQGEDRDPLIGGNAGTGRFVIPGDPKRKEEPFICGRLPSFVTLRGGGYFFLPSLTALRFLAAGVVDPR